MTSIHSQEKSDNLEPTLTKKEVAALLKCSEKHIDNCTKRGELPPPIWLGRTVRFTRTDIRNLLNGKDFDGLSNQAI